MRGGATSVKESGNQVEYEDEDPSIHKIFHEELQKRGIECLMDIFHKA